MSTKKTHNPPASSALLARHIFPVEPSSLPPLVVLLCPPASFLLSICSSHWWVFWFLLGFFLSFWGFLVSFGFAFPSTPCYPSIQGGEDGGGGHELLAHQTPFVPPKMLPGPGGARGGGVICDGCEMPPSRLSPSPRAKTELRVGGDQPAEGRMSRFSSGCISAAVLGGLWPHRCPAPSLALPELPLAWQPDEDTSSVTR